MLFSIPEFREFILRSDIDAEPFVGLKNIFRKLSSEGTKTIDIKDNFLSLRTECMEEMTVKQLLNTQEDATEFLTACILKKLEFMEQLPEFLKITKNSYTLCNEEFEGVGVPSTGPSLIPIDSTANNIQDNLTNTLYEKSQLNRCPGGYAKHNFFEGEIPKYILLSLNRFVYNVKSGVQQKVDKPVEINNRIEIPFENGMVRYKIKGFISHVGPSASEGHYYYTGKADDNQWRIYNDTHIGVKDYIKPGPYLAVEKDEKKNVYILLYELVEPAAAVLSPAPVRIPVRIPVRAPMRAPVRAPTEEELIPNMAAMTIQSSQSSGRTPELPSGRQSRSYNKKSAINYLMSRKSVSPNTRNRTQRKITYGVKKGKQLTEENINRLIQKSRAEKKGGAHHTRRKIKK